MNVHVAPISPSLRHWAKNLAAKQAGEPLTDIHDGDARCGFYRVKRRGAWVGAFIRFNADGQLICRIGDEMADPKSVWLQLASEPIDRAACETWFETGSWPGEAPRSAAPAGEAVQTVDAATVGAQTASPAPIGHNSPPSEIPVLMSETLESARDWLRQVGNAITTDEQVKIATNKVGAIRELVSKAKKAHKIEKEPHLEAGRAVDNKYNPGIKSLETAAQHLTGLIDKLINARAEAARIERERLEAEHAKRVAAAEKKGKAPPPPPAPTVPEPSKTLQSDTGRALSQREVPTLEMLPGRDNLIALAAHLIDTRGDEFAEMLFSLAGKSWKASGTPPPGTHVVIKTRVQ